MRTIDNIILIGFMGSGKSTVGAALARRLGRPFCEMDEVAREISGRKSIADIFDRDGELRFRECELEAAERLSEKRGVIVATGGGAIMNKVNIDRLARTGMVVHLYASFEEILSRLQGDTTRPLFRNSDMAKDLYVFRAPLYERYAMHTVPVDGKMPEHIVEELLTLIRT